MLGWYRGVKQYVVVEGWAGAGGLGGCHVGKALPDEGVGNKREKTGIVTGSVDITIVELEPAIACV